MKLFECRHCGQVLHFENTVCERCSHRLGYLPEVNALSPLNPDGLAWRALAEPDQLYRFCANAAYDVCNWLIPAETSDHYCLACRHNRTVPDLTRAENLLAWRKLEAAKHRLFYTLLRLRLPIETRGESRERGLAFDFLADVPAASGPKVMTGHDNGLITIAVAEADDAERERRRTAMGEPYRTLLGHFRHEVGHYYWDRLIDGGRLDTCRAVFGDDSQDYDAALQRHYAEGVPPHWQERFISAYATTHPWEDFAETWAHYLHIVDTLEMAGSFGVNVFPALDPTGGLKANVGRDPYRVPEAQDMLNAWLPLTSALNSLSRCLGQPDAYPFILTPTVIEKLAFIHHVVHAGQHVGTEPADAPGPFGPA